MKNIQDSLLQLGDGVKTDERNGYQMREKEERTVGQGVFVGRIFYFGVLAYADVPYGYY